ncbi:GNAT acetyltransferase 2-domain-containing protein [Protomyces lactucae-debilis]|uniref:RNA cytidine acetyltransferase n=1 Tax=Protomyces lactucae-debilis TaxID=2754530 RepID=A0A1Y2F9X1_PROLT|nr:GNAT acetyltransferase 2-domain-containing protein [Protomyces lactucae-debilis]ORY80427.1 GNAT acetyltransferase 2-domain-containing protein [Protomyces lactucae-debilis]
MWLTSSALLSASIALIHAANPSTPLAASVYKFPGNHETPIGLTPAESRQVFSEIFGVSKYHKLGMLGQQIKVLEHLVRKTTHHLFRQSEEVELDEAGALDRAQHGGLWQSPRCGVVLNIAGITDAKHIFPEEKALYQIPNSPRSSAYSDLLLRLLDQADMLHHNKLEHVYRNAAGGGLWLSPPLKYIHDHVRHGASLPLFTQHFGQDIAQHFDITVREDRGFIGEMCALESFMDALSRAPTPLSGQFAAGHLVGLEVLLIKYGVHSKTYAAGVKAMQQSLRQLAGKIHELDPHQLLYVSLLPPVHDAVAQNGKTLLKRWQQNIEAFGDHEAEESVVGSLKTAAASGCFTSQEDCEKATQQCSGHGKCKKLSRGGNEGKCFACACEPSIKKNDAGQKTTDWAGPACNKKDVSFEFQIFFWFTVMMVATLWWAVKMLASIEIGGGVLGATGHIKGTRSKKQAAASCMNLDAACYNKQKPHAPHTRSAAMPKKAIDARIPALIKNGVQEKKRSIFVVVGDKGRDQIVNLHWLLSQSKVASRPSVLWMYKKDLMGFTSHRKKRELKIKKEIKRGIRDPNDAQDPFELFIAVTNIRYTYYKESEKVLGQTFGMCVLQDFEALTPNLLARTIETVEGGGIIVLLLKTMTSLKQLYTMSMDVHSRYRTEARDDAVARFNERFILSLTQNPHALVVDDELNVLPVSGAKHVKLLPPVVEQETKQGTELKALKKNLEDTQPAGALVEATRTLDQAKAVLTFIDAIAEKTLKSTVALTAGRGRGKSAALGLAVSSAIAHGYSNIFITSPSPENLKTLFEFVFKGFDALKYAEHLDYEIIQSTNVAFNKSIVRVNVFRGHRQTIQYIRPEDAAVLGQAELVVIDEAAAIPLPLVQKLIGPYLVFMASTINGYEGTGRSLSLKLVSQLREQSRGFVGTGKRKSGGDAEVVERSGKVQQSTMSGRTLREISLQEPIRYAQGDPIESWLNKLLCLDANITPKKRDAGCPHPSQCQLYVVNRDTLFSFHPVSEAFLQKMMALYVASHYKNSPNDLQLMSDAPAHQLFVLLPPVNEDDKGLPEPLCVVQLALEGQISKESVLNTLSRGQRAGGDLIPWLVSQQFQDDEFAGLSGARVVRIATNPEYTKMGYGSRALQLLDDWYAGKITSLDESTTTNTEAELTRVTDAELEQATLATDSISVRDPRKMPPLLLKLSEKRPDTLHYLGVSYGMTSQLHKFWKRAGYAPVYLRQTANDLTGEHTCVMIKVLGEDATWLSAFAKDFKKRFMNLLGYQFKSFSAIASLSIMESADMAAKQQEDTQSARPLTKDEVDAMLSPFDMKRLESYASNLLDYHVIVDLLPMMAELYFSGRFESQGLELSGVQSCILLSLGLQRKLVDQVEQELNLPNNQILAMLVKVLKKLSTCLSQIQRQAIESTLPSEPVRREEALETDDEEETGQTFQPLQQTLEEDLEEGAAEDKAARAVREQQQQLINSLDLSQYAIEGGDTDWQGAEKQVGQQGASKTVGVKSVKRRQQGENAAAAVLEQEEKDARKAKKARKNKH